MTRYRVIDLFCGCGGFSYGFREAGFDIVLGIDMWKDAITSYQYNFPETKVINDDITSIRAKEIEQLLKNNLNDIDIIIGGPPCQGFSISGKRMLDDPRNSLYKSFVEIVAEIQPKIFVMENVPGLIRLFDGKVSKEVKSDFSSIGYNVNFEILSSENYGVPQQRKRVFFVGINKEKINNTEYFPFPEKTHGLANDLKMPITCKEAISDLDFIPVDTRLDETINYVLDPQSDYQKLMRKESSVVLNHSVTLHTKRTRDIINLVPDGGNYKDLPAELKSTRKVNIAWTRMNSNKPCFTIDTGHNHHFHYKENRVPTVRESARIQSFPDKFKFLGIRTSQFKQVGNAVPPLVAKAIATELYNLLERG